MQSADIATKNPSNEGDNAASGLVSDIVEWRIDARGAEAETASDESCGCGCACGGCAII